MTIVGAIAYNIIEMCGLEEVLCYDGSIKKLLRVIYHTKYVRDISASLSSQFFSLHKNTLQSIRTEAMASFVSESLLFGLIYWQCR